MVLYLGNDEISKKITLEQFIQESDVPPVSETTAGQFLTNDGSDIMWDDIDLVPTMSSETSGKFLTNDGASLSWAEIEDPIPDPVNHNQELLKSNNSTIQYSNIVDLTPPLQVNKNRFVEPIYTSTSYMGKSIIALSKAGNTDVFSKTTFKIGPCCKYFSADGVTKRWLNLTDLTVDPTQLLDSGTTLSNGKTYYVYCVSAGEGLDNTALKCSLNSEAPTGYTTANSSWICSFHTLCVNAGTLSNNVLSGYVAGNILPSSIFCETFKPAFASVDGMVYVDVIDAAVDIYLQSGTGTATASVYNAEVTDTRYYQNHVEDLLTVGKHLLTDNEFTAAAWGSNQKTNVQGSADPVTTGGHVDTAGRRMISSYGCEDMCGAWWQWLNSTCASGGQNWTVINTDNGSGSFFGEGFALRAGGSWADGSNCGWGSRAGSVSRASLNVSFAGRGRAYLTYGIQ